MGARQRAQKRSNKPPKTKSVGGIPQNWASSLQASSPDPFVRSERLAAWQHYSSSPQTFQNGFSLSQEARNTEKHGHWTLSTRLRDNKISFVSAGNLQRENLEKSTEEPTEIKELQEQDLSLKLADPSVEEEIEEVQAQSTLDVQVSKLDIVETSTDFEHSSRRDRQTSFSSVQSDEIIVFAGRSGSKTPGERVSRRPTPSPRIQTPSVPIANIADASSHPVFKSTPGDLLIAETSVDRRFSPRIIQQVDGRDGLLHPRQETGQEEVLGQISTPGSRLPQIEAFPSADEAIPVKLNQSIIRKSGGKDRRIYRRKQEIEEEEALMQDYIDNMIANDEDDDEEGDANQISSRSYVNRNEHFRLNTASVEEKVNFKTSANSKKKENAQPEMLVWDSDDLQDFDSLSTTDEEVDQISQILRERRRPTGMQYLVTAIGKSTGDAKWVLEKNLGSSTAQDELRIWREIRAIERNGTEEDDDDSDTTSGSEGEEALRDLVNKIESEDEENARLLERASRMTDEQIARTLAKQEELGLGGDEVMLFDGQDEDEFERGAEFIPFSAKKHTSNRTRTKHSKRATDNFPSAGAFADALDEDPYGAFDIMDFDRPSLKPKRKGRKADLPFELDEDDEWKEKIEQLWSNDRNKKAARKREREESRQAGLLKSKTNDGRVDLHTKYTNSGMDADQIKAEIRTFLIGDFETLSLGSMDSPMRASVHRLAKALSLKSHSQGAGDNRHPILTRTPHTPRYTVDSIWEIDALMAQRRYFSKPGGGWGSQKTPKGSAKIRRGGGGGNLTGASYMDGEVVGAAAPEIGAENRGRAMLEKMGWTSGMGIGALGNQGSVEVIKHVVKNTKAGLG